MTWVIWLISCPDYTQRGPSAVNSFGLHTFDPWVKMLALGTAFAWPASFSFETKLPCPTMPDCQP